jgi:hypothetical protein
MIKSDPTCGMSLTSRTKARSMVNGILSHGATVSSRQDG